MVAGASRYNDDYHHCSAKKEKRLDKQHLMHSVKALDGKTKSTFLGEF